MRKKIFFLSYIFIFLFYGFTNYKLPKPLKLIKDIPVLIKNKNSNLTDYLLVKQTLIKKGFDVITDSEVEEVISLEVERRLGRTSFANGIDVDYHKRQITDGEPMYQILQFKTIFADSLKMDTIKKFIYKITYIPKGNVSNFPIQTLDDSLVKKNDNTLLILKMLDIIAK